jgi:hypothetical protein
MSSQSQKVRHIGPSSRPVTLAKLDGRTREAALMRQVRADLTEHVGGNPNAAQRVLIQRAVILALKCAQLDAAIIDGAELSLHATNHAIAWANALRRTIAALGVEPAAAQPVDPMERLNRHLDKVRRERDEAAA